MLMLGFVREVYFRILESWEWLGDLEAGRDLGHGPHCRDREKPRSSLPVADPISGPTILFHLLINSVTILQGL
jgi:hypothetical protein